MLAILFEVCALFQDMIRSSAQAPFALWDCCAAVGDSACFRGPTFGGLLVATTATRKRSTARVAHVPSPSQKKSPIPSPRVCWFGVGVRKRGVVRRSSRTIWLTSAATRATPAKQLLLQQLPRSRSMSRLPSTIATAGSRGSGNERGHSRRASARGKMQQCPQSCEDPAE